MITTHDPTYSSAEHTDKISWLLENIVQLPFASIFLGFAALGIYFAWRQWGKHTLKLKKVVERNNYLNDLHQSLSERQEAMLFSVASDYQIVKEKLVRREEHIKDLHYRLALKDDQQSITYQLQWMGERDEGLVNKLDELTAAYKQLQSEMQENEATYRERIEELNQELSDKNSQIEVLNSQQKANSKQSESEAKQLQSKHSQIAELTKTVEGNKARNQVEVNSWKGKVNSLMLDLSDRDKLISQLRGQVTEVLKQAKSLKSSRFNQSEIYEDDTLGIVFRSCPNIIDDLKEISGVSDALEEELHKFGIYQYKQIAIWTDEQIKAFVERLSIKDRIARDMWVNQAIDLHYDKYSERLTPRVAIYRKTTVAERQGTATVEQFKNLKHEDQALQAFAGENVEPHHRFGVVYTDAPNQSDDLKEIKGVGVALEKALHELGVYRFKQIALWSPRVINEFVEDLPFGDRVTRDRWAEQALQLHEQKYGEKVN